MTARQLYRGILKAVRTYPSKNRDMMREAIVADVGDWKRIEDKDQADKALKRMRMLYGHLHMWNTKMTEVHDTKTDKIEKQMSYTDLNRKHDKDFVYF